MISVPPPSGTRAVWLDRGMNVCDCYFKSECPPHISARQPPGQDAHDHHRDRSPQVLAHRSSVDAAGHKIGQRRFVVNSGTFGRLLHWCAQWPGRRFAVEGAGGLGRSLAQQLTAAGEDVVDVPSTLSARARLLATGGDRKTDPADALHVAQAALFRTDLRKVTAEDQSTILRLLTERHDDLTGERTRIVNRLHTVLRDLLPGGAPTTAVGREGRDFDEAHPAGHRDGPLPPGHRS